jgi:catecholate siderophore receptor
VLDNRLSLTAALYRTQVENEVEADIDSPTGYSQYGEKRVKGIELGVTGHITPRWEVNAGFTIMDTKIVNGAQATAGSDTGLPYTPKRAFSSWTTYKLPYDLTIGGGARYVSTLRREASGQNPAASVPSYWVFDALLGWKVSRNVDLRLNVYNLFDKEYASSVSRNGTRYIPGAPRYASLTLDFRF